MRSLELSMNNAIFCCCGLGSTSNLIQHHQSPLQKIFSKEILHFGFAETTNAAIERDKNPRCKLTALLDASSSVTRLKGEDFWRKMFTSHIQGPNSNSAHLRPVTSRGTSGRSGSQAKTDSQIKLDGSLFKISDRGMLMVHRFSRSVG